MGVHFERARLLLEQSRYEMAQKELHQALAESPNDASAHALLGLCLSYQQQYQEATKEAETAIGLAPDSPFSHYIMGFILCERQRYTTAESSIYQAIRLNPYQASYFALLARCKYNQKLWQEALDAATQGLTLNAENIECLNYRALSLSQLGRGQEALAAAESAIAQSPQDAASYASNGWILLSHGKSPQKALECFREALRLNPNLEWARQGIVEALKAQNPIYRLMLRYFLWSSRLDNRTRWIFTFGLYFTVRILLVSFAQTGLMPLVVVVVIAYLLFVILSWIADPLFTLLLRWNKFGRLALSEKQIQQSNWWGACFLTAILSLVIWLFTKNMSALLGAIIFGLLLIPIAAIFHCRQSWTTRVMAIYTIVLVVLGISILILSMTSQSLWSLPMSIFFIAAVVSSWVSTLLAGIKLQK
jgi:tetratricopeptide (TPR) repeat protein